MESLILYIIKNFVVNSLDAFVVGLGYWLIRFSHNRILGIPLLVLYALATAGMMLYGGTEVLIWGVVMAVVGVLCDRVPWGGVRAAGASRDPAG